MTFFRFQRAHRPHMEDLRGIEGLFEELMNEADEATKSQVKYKELGSTSDSMTTLIELSEQGSIFLEKKLSDQAKLSKQGGIFQERSLAILSNNAR